MEPEKVEISQPKVVPQRKTEIIKPNEGTPSFYSNHLRSAYTVNDLRIIFGEITDATSDKVIVMERVQVAMTWLHAKVLHEFLGNHIRASEDKNGAIKTSFVSPFSIATATIPSITPPKE